MQRIQLDDARTPKARRYRKLILYVFIILFVLMLNITIYLVSKVFGLDMSIPIRTMDSFDTFLVIASLIIMLLMGCFYVFLMMKCLAALFKKFNI